MQAVAQRIVERAPGRLRPGVELVVRTISDVFTDRVPGLAAEMAFYLILSLPPLLITVFSGVALLGQVAGVAILDDAPAQVMRVGDEFLTQDAATEVQGLLANLRDQARDGIGTLLSFGFLLTILSASRALRVATVAITIAYDLEETRPGWQQFVYGLVLTIAALVVGVVVVPILVGGPELGQFIVDQIGGPEQLATLWRLAYWPGACVVLTLLLAVLYHVAAPWWTPWHRDLPGAALAMTIGLLGSYGLRYYTDRAIGDVFGTLATPLVVLVWLFVMSFAVLLGAEFNAEIEKMWPFERHDQPPEQEEARVEHPERVS